MLILIRENNMCFQLNRVEAVSLLPNFRAADEEYYFQHLRRSLSVDFFCCIFALDV